jgi:SAM-dependent methyltransferase
MTQTIDARPVVRDAYVHQILNDYAILEPGQTDSWKPVESKFQLGFRLNFFFALTRALERSRISLFDLRVLDLGCGTGRSARAYIDMGLPPDHVRGLDLRPSTIERARTLNPAIRIDVHDGGALPRGHNWVSTVTLFSSVAGRGARQIIADQITASLPTGGYVFHYDQRRANPFAGGDVIAPEGLFTGCSAVWRRPFGRFSCIPVMDRARGLVESRLRGSRTEASLREIVGDVVRPSHEAILLRKI